jgi:hypothetical protein
MYTNMADVGQCAKLPLNMAIPELSFTKVVVHSCAIRPSGYLAVLAERLGQFLALWAQGVSGPLCHNRGTEPVG